MKTEAMDLKDNKEEDLQGEKGRGKWGSSITIWKSKRNYNLKDLPRDKKEEIFEYSAG